MTDRKDWPECYRCRASYVDFIDPDCEVCEGTGHQCPNCAGAGYVHNEADKVVACRCGLTSRRLAKALGSVSALRGRLLTYTLDTLDELCIFPVHHFLVEHTYPLTTIVTHGVCQLDPSKLKTKPGEDVK